MKNRRVKKTIHLKETSLVHPPNGVNLKKINLDSHVLLEKVKEAAYIKGLRFMSLALLIVHSL